MNEKIKCHKRSIGRFTVNEYFSKNDMYCKLCLFYNFCKNKQDLLLHFNKK